jgi:hypothetical protein
MKRVVMVIALTGAMTITSPCTANQRSYKGGDAYEVTPHSME